jgi:hypothetical protein
VHGHPWHGCNKCTGCTGLYCHDAVGVRGWGNALMDAERTLPLPDDACKGLMCTNVVMQPRQTHRDQHVTGSHSSWGSGLAPASTHSCMSLTTAAHICTGTTENSGCRRLHLAPWHAALPGINSRCGRGSPPPSTRNVAPSVTRPRKPCPAQVRALQACCSRTWSTLLLPWHICRLVSVLALKHAR